MNVYRIETLPGYDDVGNPIFEILYLPFNGYEAFYQSYGTPNVRHEYPRSLIAFGNREELARKHNLANDFQNFVWSKKLINILLGVGNFEYRFLNIHIFDLELYRWACANNGQASPDFAEANTDFGYFQLLFTENTLDCFDYENSEYLPPRRPGGSPRSIKKLVLRGDQGFPPLFYVKDILGEFMSQAAKDALDAQGIELPLTKIEVS